MGSAMRIGLVRLAVFAACLLIATAAAAQTYPSRQIRLVVPFAAGGPADLLARVIADEMSKDLGQQVFVDNRPGANTIIGAELVAKADPDGYTLLMAIDGTLVMNPFLYSKLSYDPFKDFAPITLVADVPSVIEANNNVPANTVQELIDQEKAKPGTFLMGYSTPTSQVTVELLNMMAGVKIHARAVSRRHHAGHRPPRRRDSARPGKPECRAAVRARRQAENHRAHRRRTHLARAGDSDHRRDAARLRPRYLAEHRRAGENAAARSSNAARRNRRGVEPRGRARQAHDRRASSRRPANRRKSLPPSSARRPKSGAR